MGHGAHLGAFGFSNPEWVWEPLRQSGATRFFLLEAPRDEARRRLAEAGIDIEDQLKAACGGEIVCLTDDLWNPQAVAETIAHTMRDHGLQALNANISCGPNTVTYGIALAAQYHNITPYFCAPPGDQITYLRPSRRPMPSEPVLFILRYLAAAGDTVTMATLRRRLAQECPQAFQPDGNASVSRMTAQSQTNKLSRLLDRMQAEDLAIRSGSVHKRHVELTESGVALARTLGLAPFERGRIA